ncbi:protein tyrosine phosphatase [Streptomyces sp. Tu 6176]|uniref:tyrosine-protein phosphatase n=1 Tax=Streptomyces sp. Tu 6176 TaxID=1470557 RepID=UPI00044F1C00|nr:tyrosine-protein phosphatase [Streptomyces sp. Tu 6176]EYT84666.1 protein tyrosine phosphatase [Streptomyces sp. Tu 6176]
MDRHIRFDALRNVRDLGGYATEDGLRVRPRLLYRADGLGKLDRAAPDWDRFLALGIGTVIDLRHDWEVERQGRVPEHPSFTYHNLSIEHRPYDQPALGPEVDPGPYLAERYMEVAEDGAKEIRAALELIRDAAVSGTPLVFHCASGKDRTGELAALVLTLLGVPEPTVVEDFSLTELATPMLLADWRARNGGRTPRWPGYGRAPAAVMRLFLAALRERYGSVEAYVTDALELDASALAATLRAHLLEPAPAARPPLSFRRAVPADAPLLVRLRDSAALWQLARGIDQWKPGEKDEAHFRTRMREGEVWLAYAGEHLAGAWELWWDDPDAWGPRPADAGYIHRLMTAPHTAPPGTGRRLLAEAESRITATGRPYARLDCLSTNPRLRTYYETAGYTVTGEHSAKPSSTGSPYAVTLLEKRLA